MSSHKTYRALERLTNMDPGSIASLYHEDQSATAHVPGYDDPVPMWDCATIDDYFRSEVSVAHPMDPNPSVAARESSAIQPLEHWHLTSSTITEDPSQINETTRAPISYNKSKYTVESTSLEPEQIVKTRPRGRPRKDTTKQEQLPASSDSLKKYQAKNRRASARCREKERAQVETLELDFKEQMERNLALKRNETALREELFRLQIQALHHGTCGCRDVQGYNKRRARDVAIAWNLGN
jgi:hypothetical protein